MIFPSFLLTPPRHDHNLEKDPRDPPLDAGSEGMNRSIRTVAKTVHPR